MRTVALQRVRRVALLVGLLSSVGAASAADRFVSVAGSDTANDCLVSSSPCGTIGYAIAQATSGDVVKVTEGQFLDPLSAPGTTGTLTLSGGWSLDFSSQSSSAYSMVGSSVLFRKVGNEVLDLSVERFSFNASLGAEVVVGTRDSSSLTASFQDCILKRATSFGAIAEGTSTLNLTLSNTRMTGKGAFALLLAAENATLDATMSNVSIDRNRTTAAAQTPALEAFSRDSGVLTLVATDVTIARNARPGIKVISADTSSCSVSLANAQVRYNRSGIVASGPGTFLSVTNSVVARNKSRDATGIGGLSLLDGAYSIVNSTVRGNRSACCTAGLVTNGAVAMSNAIVWENRTTNGPADNLEVAGATLDVDHSDIGPGVSGSYNDLGGNIIADPLFAGIRNEHLDAVSPAVDTGTCIGAPATDFEGDPRPTGAGCDMGADEVAP